MSIQLSTNKNFFKLHLVADRWQLIADRCLSGADEGTRTPDPLITNQLLYQLSYIGYSSTNAKILYNAASFF
jgi:hypothetical protein